jgi:signal transduction histidine kinase
VLSQALLAVGLVCVGVFYTHRRLLGAMDASLNARALRIAALVRYSEDSPHRLVFEKDLIPKQMDASGPDHYQVIAKGFGVIATSRDLPGELQSDCPSDGRRWDLEISGMPYRAICMPKVTILDREEGQRDQPSNLAVTYAAPTVELHSQVRTAGISIALASLLLLALTVWLAVWRIRHDLLPLQEMATRASQVTPQNWEFRSPTEADLMAELKPLSQAMQTMIARLRHSFLEQKEFLGNAAHELKTPVTILKSTLQSLLQRRRTPEEYEQGVRQALDDMERLEKLLRWMLRLARAEQRPDGNLRPDVLPINVSATCAEAIDAIRGLAQEKDINVDFQGENSVICRADPEDLEVVWVNLLENAVRYSPRGSRVNMKLQRNGNSHAKVLVEDQGPGISPEELPHIFERFRRGDASRARETGGFGLGLAIAKAFVEAYGGIISAQSQAGKGTRMTVELPLYSPK